MAAIASEPGASPLVLFLFGRFEAHLHGAPLPPLRSRKVQWLLGLLTLRAGRDVERAWLMEILWPDSPEIQASSSLRTSLKDLRRSLGPEADRLRSPTPRTLSLDLSGAYADVLAFDQAIARGYVSSLEQAVALYRGPLLDGCVEAWAFEERQVREQAYLRALETLAANAQAGGNLAAAERYLRRAVTADPLRETIHRALMQALAAAGNYAAAAHAYRELCRLLQRELNTLPDPTTTALFQQLRAEARSKTVLGAQISALVPTAAPASQLVGRQVVSSAESREPRAESGSTATLTFLFTDVQESTRLWEEHPEAMREALAHHDALLRQAIEAHGGQVFKTMGDQFCAAFATAPDALEGALAAQRALLAALDPTAGDASGAPPSRSSPGGRCESEPVRLCVRMALHTGTVEERDGDYFGPALNRLARFLEVGHGGQVLLSAATQELVRDVLPEEEISLRDLGEHRLRDLTRPERIFQLLSPDLPANFPPLDTLDARPNNLPAQPTPLVGREGEVAAIRDMLRREGTHKEGGTRLVTLSGTGGTGKTRLGLQVAAELLDTFVDGVFFVALAPLRDPDLVPGTIARALGVKEAGDRPVIELLKEHLREKRLLLLLDNFEHLLPAAPFVAELLASCHRLKVLVTSREVLHLRGEKEVAVAPLATPDPKQLPAVPVLSQYAAVALFIQRALDVDPEFAVTNENAPAVAAICHRLDGLPLAIELAAARSKLLSPEALLARLERRLPLLVGGARDLPARHQTLRGAIAWSYDLLTEEEQRLFARLAVFVGGFTLEAAVAVCVVPSSADSSPTIGEEAILESLASLVDKSLVRREPSGGEAGGAGGERRFGMLETIREFAQECLTASGESEAIRRRHAEYYLALTEEAERQILSPNPLAGLDRLERDQDNLRAVLTWAIERGSSMPEDEAVEIALRLGGAARNFWNIRGYGTEAREWLGRLLAIDESVTSDNGPARTAARAKALHGAALLAYFQGDGNTARALDQKSLPLARASGDRALLARVLQVLGAVASRQGDLEAAQANSEECVAIARELGDRRLIGMTTGNLGFFAQERGDLKQARVLLDEGLAILRELGDDYWVSIPLAHLGTVRTMQGDYPGALACLEEALTLARGRGDPRVEGLALSFLGTLARYQGDLKMARTRYEESIRLHGTHRNRGELMGDLVGLGIVTITLGERSGPRPDRAASVRANEWLLHGTRLLGAAEALREATGWVIWSHDKVEHEKSVAAARAALGEAAFAAAWAEGRALSLEQACDLALAEAEPASPAEDTT